VPLPGIEKETSYQFGCLKAIPVERGFAFSIGKNSKIRARKTEPRIDFKNVVGERMTHLAPIKNPFAVLFNDP
jgi:hypothetical protein